MRNVISIIGHPIHNSLTPAIQRAALQAKRLETDFELWDTPPEQIDSRLQQLRSSKILGAQISTPYRTRFMSYVDSQERLSTETGACNVVVNRNGKLTAHNTDVIGFENSLAEAEFDLKGKRALILGAGGAAKAALIALRKKTREITVWNHDAAELYALDNFISTDFAKTTFLASQSRPGSNERKKELKQTAADADIIVHATIVGMSSSVLREQTLLTADMIPPGCLVFEIVANPIMTPLLQEATKVGAKVLPGLEMLLHSSAAAFHLWTGQHPSLSTMRGAAEVEFRRQQET